MNSQELLENVEWLRCTDKTNELLSTQTINALVQLVGEMEAFIAYAGHNTGCDAKRGFPKTDCSCGFTNLITKAAPIAALAKGEA